MYEVIFFIRPFNAFIGSLGTILFLFILGGLGILLGLVSRKERVIIRVVMFLIGGFLLLVGGMMSVLMVQEYTTEAVNFTTQLEDKNMPLEYYGENSSYTSYELNAQDGQKFRGVVVNHDTREYVRLPIRFQAVYYRARYGAMARVGSIKLYPK